MGLNAQDRAWVIAGRLVHDQFASQEDIAKFIAAALDTVRAEALEEAAMIVEDCGKSNVENPAIDWMERSRRMGIRWCGEWAAKRIRALASEEKRDG